VTPVTVTVRAHTYFAGFSEGTGERIVEILPARNAVDRLTEGLAIRHLPSV